MDNKYYTPNIEEFYVGFEYEFKEKFTDGTIKTQKKYNKANWIKGIICVRDIPYINRSLNGKNGLNGISGIRVKFLDKEDIESLGFIFYMVDNVRNYTIYRKEDIQIFKGLNTNILIINRIDITETFSYNNILFTGTIKNKSELIKLIKHLY